MGKYAIVEYLLRAFVTAVLALGITVAAAYQVIIQHTETSPFVNWAGIIVGVYFGAQVATRGEDRRRRHEYPRGDA